MAQSVFLNISYLKHGNKRQQLAYGEIIELDLWNLLKAYDPILTGTIPIEIDISTSDLDVICCVKDHQAFTFYILQCFQHMPSFVLKTTTKADGLTTIVRFQGRHFPIEIFAQSIPSQEQMAYQHMIIEYQILQANGKDFQENVIQLKREGMKTEPAFAKLLDLEGDPYQALLSYGQSLK